MIEILQLTDTLAVSENLLSHGQIVDQILEFAIANLVRIYKYPHNKMPDTFRKPCFFQTAIASEMQKFLEDCEALKGVSIIS